MRKNTSRIWKIPLSQFIEVFNKSNTFVEMLGFFNLKHKGGNYRTLIKRFKQEGIDYSKFSKKRYVNSGIKKLIPLEQILTVNNDYSRYALKSRLLKGGFLENQCYCCRQGPIWNDKPLVLILDHINGIYNDNRIENLRMLCPNCNSQTETFAGRNIKRDVNTCDTCNTSIKNKSTSCPKCNSIKRRVVDRPSAKELSQLLWQEPITKIAQRYEVSDKAVGQWIKSYSLEKPPRGYWLKSQC